jgi:hypothetical protein
MAEAHRPQFSDERLLADLNTKLGEHPLRQIGQAPAHDPMNRWNRTALDDRLQSLAPLRAQEPRMARSLAVHEPAIPFGVERQHPIPDRLELNAPDPSSLCTRTAIIDRHERQKTADLVTVHRTFRKPTQSPPHHNLLESRPPTPWQNSKRLPW